MRPGARLAAAIDVLADWKEGRASLEAVLAAWGRTHRFAGSKDRAAIADRAYAVLRRRNQCAWVMQADTPRGWVLGSLVVEDYLDLEGIEALLAGDPHTPDALSAQEKHALARGTSSGPVPPWVAGNYPEWLHGELIRSLGDRLEPEMAAMAERAPLDLRVNRLKASREDALRALAAEGVAAEPWPLVPDALRCAPGVPVQKTGAYEQGLVEIQDCGAQVAVKLAGAKPGETVIDLAAGAGGKALALAAEMGNRGRILATDIDPVRLDRLGPRAQRAGAGIIQTHPAGAPLESGLAADCVVLDVPCSGSGTWRRHPDQKWRLSEERLRELTDIQADLLDQGAALARPGGRLVYITCSLLARENEDTIQAFLLRRPDFRERPPERSLADAGLFGITCREDGLGVSLTPGSCGTDGFFIAVLERVGASGLNRTDKGLAG